MTRGGNPVSLNNDIGWRTIFERRSFYIDCVATTDVECEFSTSVLRMKPMLNGKASTSVISQPM